LGSKEIIEVEDEIKQEVPTKQSKDIEKATVTEARGDSENVAAATENEWQPVKTRSGRVSKAPN
jgi:hypothetical protein